MTFRRHHKFSASFPVDKIVAHAIAAATTVDEPVLSVDLTHEEANALAAYHRDMAENSQHTKDAEFRLRRADQLQAFWE